MISIYDPKTYSNNYDDAGITQLSAISTQSIAAYSDLLSNNNLTIGATSNINFKAKNSIQLYFNQSNDISFYTTDNFGNSIKRIFSINTSNDTTIFSGSNVFFDIGGNTNLWTNSNVIINPSNGGSGNANIYINSNGYLMPNNVAISSNLIVGDNITSYKNIACAGNVFASTFNLFTNIPNCNVTSNLYRVSYSFHINKYNQLDLLRSDEVNSNNQLISKIQRIMTFGNTEFKNQLKDNPDNYLVMSQFSGVTGNYSNGLTPGMTEVRWTPSSLNLSNICYTKGYIGIGTTNPVSPLHVLGTTTVQGDIIPMDDIIYNLGSSNKRFKELHLSGQTIHIGNHKISVDKTGHLNFIKPCGHCINITGGGIVTFPKEDLSQEMPLGYPQSPIDSIWNVNSSNVYILSSNIGIGTSTPEYSLDINGSIRATKYCNLLIDSYTSDSLLMAPTASNFAVTHAMVISMSNSLNNFMIDTKNQLSNMNSTINSTVNLLANTQSMLTTLSNNLHTNLNLNLNKSNSEISSSTKISSGIIEIGKSPTTILSLDSSYTGNFYTLYIGPTTIGNPYYAHGFVFWDNINKIATVSPISSNNGLTLINNSSNIEIYTDKESDALSTMKHPQPNTKYNYSCSDFYMYDCQNAFNITDTSHDGWRGELNMYDLNGIYIGATGDWIQIELPSPIKLSSYSIKPESDGCPASWNIEGSSDNIKWTTIDTVYNYIWKSLNETEFTISPDIQLQEYQFYRLVITKILSGNTVHIKNFYVYGLEKLKLKYPWYLYKM